MNETQYMNKVKVTLEQLASDCYFEKIWGGGFQASGIPDIVGVYRGYYIGLELKVGNNKPSELQVFKINKIREAGGFGAIIWDKQYPVIHIINTIDNYLDGEITKEEFDEVRYKYNVKGDSHA